MVLCFHGRKKAFASIPREAIDDCDPGRALTDTTALLVGPSEYRAVWPDLVQEIGSARGQLRQRDGIRVVSAMSGLQPLLPSTAAVTLQCGKRRDVPEPEVTTEEGPRPSR